MNIYFVFIVFLILFFSKYFFKSFNKDYMSKQSTSCVKGVFILIVFYSHIKNYINTDISKNFLMLGLRDWLGQLMVTLFLFYSGFGIYESIKKKKKEYIDSIPKRRCLKTILHFAFAVTLYLILSFIINKSYPIKTILLSYIGWNSIGNSNWYIFGIVILYFLTYLSFQIFDKNDKLAIRMSWILTIIFTLGLSLYRPDYCYNTLWCYPLGLTYSYYKNDIEKIFMKENKKYLIALILTFISVFILKKYAVNGFMYYELLSIAFCLLIVLITMKINLQSKILKWFGDNLFWIYILQRLPMIYLTYTGYNIHPYRFCLICFIITIIISIICKQIVTKLDGLIFKGKKKLA